jgi:hypothetical protein
VRSYKPEVQKHLLAAIARIAKAEAETADAPREPTVFVVPDQSAECCTRRRRDRDRRDRATRRLATPRLPTVPSTRVMAPWRHRP